MTRLLLIGVAALVLLVAIVWVGGLLLPVSHVASASRVVPRPADDVFRQVADIERYPEWWSDVSQIDVVAREADGRLRFRQHSSDGAILMAVVQLQPPTKMITRIADPDQPFGGTWTFDVQPDGTATRLTITERGEVYNPIFRFLGRFVFGHTDTIDSFLNALTRTD